MLSPTKSLSASWFVAEASDGILLFIVFMFVVFPLISVSIVTILSRTAFLLGAIQFTPSQVLALYASLLTAHCVAAVTWSSTYFLLAASVSTLGVAGTVICVPFLLTIAPLVAESVIGNVAWLQSALTTYALGLVAVDVTLSSFWSSTFCRSV